MRRGPSSLLLATGLHAALLVGVTVARAPREAERAARRVEPKSVEIDLDLATMFEPAALAGPLPDLRESEREAAPRRYAARRSAKSAPRAAEARDEPTEPSVAAPPVPEKETDHGALPPGYRESPVDVLGANIGTNPFLARRPTEGDRPDKGAERAIRSTLLERDRGLGLGASGPVVAAVEEVARTSTASVESHAVLEVVADGEGQVVSVTVSDASEDRGGWDAVAKGLLAAMRNRRLHVAPGSRGVAMTIAIESRETLPSGAAPGVNVTLFDQKVHSGKNERSANVAILPLARLPIELPVPGRPGVTQTKTIVLPLPTPNISAVFDVSDLAAPAARVVHAHATSEREL